MSNFDWWSIGSFVFLFPVIIKHTRHPPSCARFICFDRRNPTSPSHRTSCPVPGVTNLLPRFPSRPSVDQTRAPTGATPSTREAAARPSCSWMSAVSDGCHGFCACMSGALHCNYPSGQIFPGSFAAQEHLKETHKVSAKCLK